MQMRLASVHMIMDKKPRDFLIALLRIRKRYESIFFALLHTVVIYIKFIPRKDLL